jgi:hypothetical protein
MTRIERIDADPFLALSAMIRARSRHPRSIDVFFAQTPIADPVYTIENRSNFKL